MGGYLQPNIQNFESKEAFFLFADIRGFTLWSSKYQLDVRKLVSFIYENAYAYFGSLKSQVLLSRVVKFLGDGFFAVREYTTDNFELKFNSIIQRCIDYNNEFNDYIRNNRFHEPDSISFGYGLSFGSAERFNIQGMPFYYIGDRVNFSSRLCSSAEGNQIVLDNDLYENIKRFKKKNELDYKITTDIIDLKGFPNTRVRILSISNEL